MNKIILDKIIVDNSDISDILSEYNILKINIKDSNAKLKELKKFITREDYETLIFLRDNNSKELESFLLEKPMLSEYIDESNYNKLLKESFDSLLRSKVDLSKLSNGIKCQHEFIILNNQLLCINCFIKEDDLNIEDEDFYEFFIDAAISQGMFIDELDESELGLLEQIKMEHKDLINSLEEQKNNLPENDRLNIDETIIALEKNKVYEFKKSLKKKREEKLSMKR